MTNSTIHDTNATIADLKKEIEKKIKDAVAPFKEQLFDELVQLLKQAPAIKEIRWTQGTPAWNDGDTCTFGVYDVEFMGVDEENFECGYDTETVPKEQHVFCDKIEELVSSLDESIMEMVFGNNKQISLSAISKKFKVEDYDMDY